MDQKAGQNNNDGHLDICISNKLLGNIFAAGTHLMSHCSSERFGGFGNWNERAMESWSQALSDLAPRAAQAIGKVITAAPEGPLKVRGPLRE